MWRSTPKLDFGLPKFPHPQSPRPMQRHYGIPQAQGPQGYPSTVTWQIMDDHGDDVIMRWCGFRKNRSLFSWRLFCFFSCVDSHLWFLVVSYVLNGWLQELNFNHGCCPSLNFHTSPLSFSFYGNKQSGTGRLCRLHWVWKHICSPQVWAPSQDAGWDFSILKDRGSIISTYIVTWEMKNQPWKIDRLLLFLGDAGVLPFFRVVWSVIMANPEDVMSCGHCHSNPGRMLFPGGPQWCDPVILARYWGKWKVVVLIESIGCTWWMISNDIDIMYGSGGSLWIVILLVFYSFTWETVTIHVQVINYETFFISFECIFWLYYKYYYYLSYAPCFYNIIILYLHDFRTKTWRPNWWHGEWWHTSPKHWGTSRNALSADVWHCDPSSYGCLGFSGTHPTSDPVLLRKAIRIY